MIDVFGLLVVSMMNLAGAGRVPDHMLFLALNITSEGVRGSPVGFRSRVRRGRGRFGCIQYFGRCRGPSELPRRWSEPGGLAPASDPTCQHA